ncbi:hypothetical protein PPL_04020 [Heterostelium album PN500]|uniref:Uncharacterized protein n=1 Tax=Heterostelium pallidum (strain ATCC 26659 / Pp 5 / PN500) TaxID=670386 RepID=D3B5T2_HETP5|nr:hypothetical protein PPL_04020 [Heterostelium album PN500]EFA83230.1 hypothetical protein PPL_04020 [Heterostelium album PN500]|eukprot:XP_020435347.1 hypothetical protein PPL_04020 [Heterostelium album PN500]
MDNDVKYLANSLNIVVDDDEIIEENLRYEVQQQQQKLKMTPLHQQQMQSKDINDPQRVVDTVLKTVVDVFRDCIERIDNGAAKDAIDLFQPYISEEQFRSLRDMSQKISGDAAQQLDCVNETMLAANLNNYLMPQGVAAKLTKLKAAKSLPRQAAPIHINKAASYNSNGQPATGGGSSGGSSSRRRESKEGFPLNMGAIIGMAANMNLDQIKSMMNVLIMILTHTPIPVILREFHRFRMLTSVFFDLIVAIYRFDVKEIASLLIITILNVISFMNKKDKNLITEIRNVTSLYIMNNNNNNNNRS